MLKQSGWFHASSRLQALRRRTCTTLTATLLLIVGATSITSYRQSEAKMNDLLYANDQSWIATKFSYIDRTGKVVIDAGNYESAGNFSEGLAAVLDPRKGWGFIDRTGTVVIPPRFESALSFSDGLAAVVLDGKWGFIDQKGNLVIANQFEWVAEFSEGVAVVQRASSPPKAKVPSATGPQTLIHEVLDLKGDSNVNERPDVDDFMVIDKSGQILAVLDDKKVQVNLDLATFSEGLLCAYSPEEKAVGYVNKSAEFVIQPKFAEAGPFSEGLARVAVRENNNEKLAFIDKEGKFVIPPTFNTDYDFPRNASEFSEGLAALSEGLNPSHTKKETFVYIDKAGKIVLSTDFVHAGKFRDGLAAVYNGKTNRWGFIDKTGKIAVPVMYELANDFSEGLALVASP